MRTKREIFEIVKAHLLAQRAPAMDGVGYGCVYRADNGRKCAVGCLIPDEAYTDDIEGTRLLGLTQYNKPDLDLPDGAREGWAKVEAAVPELRAYSSMLLKLQQCHDEASVPRWEARLNAIGLDEFGLDNQDVVGV